jgi:hypothetical protein
MDDSSNFVTTFDSSAISLYLVRGISLCTVTAAQITAGAYIVIQELGIAPVYVTTATATAPGANCAAATAAAVTTTTPTTSVVIASFGYTLDTVAAATTVRCVLTLPVLQG